MLYEEGHNCHKAAHPQKKRIQENRFQKEQFSFRWQHIHQKIRQPLQRLPELPLRDAVRDRHRDLHGLVKIAVGVATAVQSPRFQRAGDAVRAVSGRFFRAGRFKICITFFNNFTQPPLLNNPERRYFGEILPHLIWGNI